MIVDDLGKLPIKKYSHNVHICNSLSFSFCLQRGQEVKGVVFRTTLIAWAGFNPHRGRVIGPWIRRFTMIISARQFRTSCKFCGQKFEEIHGKIGSLETPKQVRIPPTTN